VWRGRGPATVAAATRDALAARDPADAQAAAVATTAEAVVDANGNFIGISDYEAQFKALWGVK
jgi:hypothetical protein